MKSKVIKLGINLSMGLIISTCEVSLALPPPEDIPEEVLRAEIILEGSSPLNGEPLTAAEYVEIERQLAENPYPAQLTSRIQHLVFLLRVRKLLKTVVPIL